jgi:hypothetical protein
LIPIEAPDIGFGSAFDRDREFQHAVLTGLAIASILRFRNAILRTAPLSSICVQFTQGVVNGRVV